MAARVRSEVAAPWEPFLGRTDHTAYPRGSAPGARIASPQGSAHHCQGIVTTPGSYCTERGIAESDVVVDAGVTYAVRASERVLGPSTCLKAALRAADGETVLAETVFDVEPVTTTCFGPEFPHNALWMDDQSWTTVEGSLTAGVSDPSGWFTLTFPADPEEVCLWMVNWVSLIPADNVGGWQRGVVEHLATLPAQSLKWPGGCMAEDYDWRYGLGPRDDRYGKADQAWAAWDENDVGIDEFVHLCRITGAEPIVGVNAGNGSAKMAAALVEYCNAPASSPWGSRRAASGHPHPYGVRHFVAGNEQRGSSPSATPELAPMPFGTLSSHVR